MRERFTRRQLEVYMKKCSQRYAERNKATHGKGAGSGMTSYREGMEAARARGEVRVIHGH